MSGEPDPQYSLARRALLDGLAALAPHLDSIVVIGAQAVYLHTGPADLAIAEFTTDADLAIGPQFLATDIGGLMRAQGFHMHDNPGMWRTPDGIQVDLLVPETLAGRGRRSAELRGHGRRVSRRAKGIEGALVDHALGTVRALDRADRREFDVSVAGPAALLVAKVHKIAERADTTGRTVDKDALDVFRLLRAIPLEEMARGMRRLLASDLAGDVTREAIELADGLLGQPDDIGPRMASRAVGGLEDPDVIAASLAALYTDVTNELRQPP